MYMGSRNMKTRKINLALFAVFGLLALFLGSVGGTEKKAATKPASRPASRPVKWTRPRFTAKQSERDSMVSRQIRRRGIKTKAVLEAMRRVPRHLFVSSRRQKHAYGDFPLGIGYGQTISQPYVVALMTDLAELKAGEKVLEVGTGSGYQAAVCSEITPYVYSMEIIQELGLEVKTRLKKLGYKTIKTKTGDGYYGWAEHGPFDAILVTCAATHVPNPLVKQLKPGGKMVIPVGSYGAQNLLIITKDKNGRIKSRNILPVRFVPLTGGH